MSLGKDEVFYHIRCVFTIFHSLSFRYQFFLQLKRDILQGRLPVSFDLSAELAAYAVQCELWHVCVCVCVCLWVFAFSYADYYCC